MEEGKLNKLGKKMLSGFAKKAIIICIIILVISAGGYVSIIKNGSYSKDDKSNTGYVTEQKIAEHLNEDKIVKTRDGWKYDMDMNVLVDEIIKELDENSGTLNTYISKTLQQEYLKSFIKADIITRYPDLRSANKIGTEVKDDEFQGCIQIHKALANGDTQILSYIDYDTFDSYISNGNSEATNYFTLNQEDEILVAGWTRTTTNVTSNEPDVENVIDKVEYTLIAKPIKYKSVVSSYSMPFDFLWALTVCGDDAEFAYEVSQLAVNSKIVLTVQENYSVSDTTITEEYKTQDKIIKSATFNVNIDGTKKNKEYKSEVSQTPIAYKTVTKTKIENSSIKVNVTEADTWILRYKNTVTNNQTTSTPLVSDSDGNDDTEYELSEKYVNTEELKEEIDKELENYMIGLCTNKKEYQNKKANNKINGTATNLKSERYSRTIDQKITYETFYSRNKYELGTASVLEKTNKESEEDNFITLFIKNQKARNNILDGSEWFFEILENSEDTVNMIDLIKYLFYKATGNSYGITEYEFEVADILSMTSIKGAVTENFIKAWENYPLWLYETEQSKTFPKGYLTEDEKNYIVYEDGSAGHNNIAYGWATFISSKGTLSSNSEYYRHPTYGAGYWNWRLAFSEVGISVETLHKGALVDVDSCKSVFKDVIIPTFTDRVDSALTYFPEYEFSITQKDALISVCYQYGNIGNFVSAFKKSLNEEGTIDTEVLKENFVVNGVKVFKYTNVMGDRKYANWYLFTEGKYLDPAGNEIKVSMAEYAYMVADYFLNCGVDIHYAGNSNPKSKNNGRSCVVGDIKAAWRLPVEEPERYGIVCATFVTFAIWQSGAIDEDTINNWEATYNDTTGVATMLEQSKYKDEWLQITNWEDLEEGDVVNMVGHIYIYIDGEKMLDQNYCSITSEGADYRRTLTDASQYRKDFIKGYRYIGK